MKQRYILILLFCGLLPTLFAQDTKQMKELERRRKAALEMIEETNRVLSSTKKNTENSLGKLRAIDAEIKARKEVISLLNRELKELNDQQYLLSLEIGRLQREIKEKKLRYANAIDKVYSRQASCNKLMFVLSSNTIGQSIRRMRYLREYTSWRRIQAEEIKEKQTQLEEKRVELEGYKVQKREVLGMKTTETSKLALQQNEQKAVVSSLQKKTKELQSQLSTQKKRASDLNRRIQQLIEEEARAAAERSRKRAEEEARVAAERAKASGQPVAKVAPAPQKSQSTLTYYMTKEEQELSGSFERNRGKLPLPLSGSYIVTGRFGLQAHQELKHVQVNNNGIDLQTKPGTQARAVFSGDVTKVFVMPGYNSTVIVRHGNYLTIYSNLSDVYVKSGDKVSTKQNIGKIYSDPEEGNLTVLHFQLWKETTKINPEYWLDL